MSVESDRNFSETPQSGASFQKKKENYLERLRRMTRLQSRGKSASKVKGRELKRKMKKPKKKNYVESLQKDHLENQEIQGKVNGSEKRTRPKVRAIIRLEILKRVEKELILSAIDIDLQANLAREQSSTHINQNTFIFQRVCNPGRVQKEEKFRQFLRRVKI